jgi:hypothetical protein
MNVGDMIELWSRSTPGASSGPDHRGIIVGWNDESVGWEVLVDEKVEVFAVKWWTAIKVNKNEDR